eukprot:1549464-Rhodomonas_salina.1
MLNWRQSASGTDQQQQPLTACCMPICSCYLGTHMPSQHFRARDRASETSSVLGAAQMLNCSSSLKE